MCVCGGGDSVISYWVVLFHHSVSIRWSVMWTNSILVEEHGTNGLFSEEQWYHLASASALPANINKLEWSRMLLFLDNDCCTFLHHAITTVKWSFLFLNIDHLFPFSIGRHMLRVLNNALVYIWFFLVFNVCSESSANGSLQSTYQALQCIHFKNQSRQQSCHQQ